MQFTLTFEQGTSRLCRDITIVNDNIAERPEERFEVIITSTDPQATVGTPNRATVIIEDDDRKWDFVVPLEILLLFALCILTAVVIGFEEIQYTVGENSGSVSVVVAVLQGELSEDISVVFTTDDGTASSQCKLNLTLQILSQQFSQTHYIISNSTERNVYQFFTFSQSQLTILVRLEPSSLDQETLVRLSPSQSSTMKHWRTARTSLETSY